MDWRESLGLLVVRKVFLIWSGARGVLTAKFGNARNLNFQNTVLKLPTVTPYSRCLTFTKRNAVVH